MPSKRALLFQKNNEALKKDPTESSNTITDELTELMDKQTFAEEDKRPEKTTNEYNEKELFQKTELSKKESTPKSSLMTRYKREGKSSDSIIRSIYFNKDVYDYLVMAAKSNGISVSKLINNIVLDYFMNPEE